MNTNSYSARLQLKAAPMMTGIVLVGTGGLICMAGLIVGGTAVCSATRKWFRAQDVQSSQAVKPKWGKRPKMTPKVTMTASPAMNGNGARVRSGHA